MMRLQHEASGVIVNVDEETALTLGSEWEPFAADEQVVVDETGTDLEPADVVGETVTDEQAESLPPAETDPVSPIGEDGIPVVGETVTEKPTRQRRK